MKNNKFELIEHTGDIGLRIFGNRIEDLFQNAAEGLFEIITDGESTVVEQMSTVIEASGENYEELLINWLSELTFRVTTFYELYIRFEIIQLNTKFIRARIFGERINSKKHNIALEIKAVTYHQLFVKQKPDGHWEARVIFDI